MATDEPTRLRVTIVEDVADLRDLLRWQLENTGHFEVVGEAADGDAAVELVKAMAPDLVVLDLSLPGRSGLEILPEIRASAPDARVVVWSGSAQPDARRRALDAGARSFITKGGSLTELLEELLAAVGLGPEARETRTRLPAELTSGRQARGFLEDLLRTWGCEEVTHDVQLLATELVNNAVTHAGSSVDLSVRLHDGRLRVEVGDRGLGAPLPEDPDLEATRGRGLFLVAALADRWGTNAHGDRKWVWFEVQVPSVS